MPAVMKGCPACGQTSDARRAQGRASGRRESPALPYRDIGETPWYRRSAFASASLVLGGLLPNIGVFGVLIIGGMFGSPFLELFGLVFLVGAICTPLFLAACILCLTGDIYQVRQDGTLGAWSRGNKVVAVVFLVLQAVSILWWLGSK